MKNQQKQAAERLREENHTYKEIAAVLGLSESCIKSYFRKRKAPGTDPDQRPESAGTGFCEECGAPVEYIPHHKKKRFCSYECRMKWWKEHPEAGHRKAFYTYTCACCGKKFTAYGNANRKYCSVACAGKGAVIHE